MKIFRFPNLNSTSTRKRTLGFDESPRRDFLKTLGNTAVALSLCGLASCTNFDEDSMEERIKQFDFKNQKLGSIQMFIQNGDRELAIMRLVKFLQEEAKSVEDLFEASRLILMLEKDIEQFLFDKAAAPIDSDSLIKDCVERNNETVDKNSIFVEKHAADLTAEQYLIEGDIQKAFATMLKSFDALSWDNAFGVYQNQVKKRKTINRMVMLLPLIVDLSKLTSKKRRVVLD